MHKEYYKTIAKEIVHIFSLTRLSFSYVQVLFMVGNGPAIRSSQSKGVIDKVLCQVYWFRALKCKELKK